MINQTENPYYDCQSIQNITAEKILELLTNLLEKRKAPYIKNKEYAIKNNTIGDINENTNLFRIMSFEKVLESIRNNQFALVKASRWNKNDPLEYNLRNEIITDENNETIEFLLLSEQLYGSCFSLKEECIKLWNVFGGKDKTEPYVKIKTSHSKFMNYFYDETQENTILNFFAGQIYYLKNSDMINITKQIKEIWKSNFKDNKNIDLAFLHVFPLLIKSNDFEYEQEVRFICAKMMGFNNPYYHFTINPNELFEEIVFLPWILDTDFEKYKKQLIDLRYTGIIKKSDLTDF
ncbi:MAG: hypothetical protein PHY39_05555 [Endomicrobiaceae bacterium]|nr:hypothetical protein [Endomicrobiaceae bacterium]